MSSGGSHPVLLPGVVLLSLGEDLPHPADRLRRRPGDPGRRRHCHHPAPPTRPLAVQHLGLSRGVSHGLSHARRRCPAKILGVRNESPCLSAPTPWFSAAARPVRTRLQRRQSRRSAPCRSDAIRGVFYRPPSRLLIVSSVGQGGPSCSARSNSSPNRLPFGNWSPRSQRHAATIARTSCRHSSSSPWSTFG